MKKESPLYDWYKIPLKEWALVILYIIGSVFIAYEYMKPFFAERYFRDGFNLSVSQRYKYAITDLNKAIAYAPWETHYMTQLGRTKEAYANTLSNKKEKKKVYLELETLYKHMISLDPYNPWFKNRLAITYTSLEQLYPEKKEVYFNLARLLHKEAAHVDNQNPLFQLNYAYFIHQRGQTLDEKNKAIPYYKRVISMDARIHEARYNLADLYRKNNQLSLVLNEYLNIYKANPNFKSIRTGISSIYIALNQLESAVPFLVEAYTEQPNNIEILRNLAGIYYQLSEWRNAGTAYKQLFILSPGLTQNYGKFYVQALINSKQYKLAYSELKQYKNQYPNDNDIKNTLFKLKDLLKIK